MSDPISGSELMIRGRMAAIDPMASRSELGETKNEEAARQMEELFMGLLIKEMRRSIPNGLFQGSGSAIYEGLFDRAMATSMTEQGGTGLREQIMATLPDEKTVVDLNSLAAPSDVVKDNTESRVPDSENELSPR